MEVRYEFKQFNKWTCWSVLNLKTIDGVNFINIQTL